LKQSAPEQRKAQRKRIAVIGSGISGMAAAYFLSHDHEVHLFERADRLGGHTHTHTIEATVDGQKRAIPIDTGFIVHNERTYPNLIRLFRELGVMTANSDMSFGVSDRATGFEWSSRGLSGFFADRRNWLSLKHYTFLLDILRFNREAHKLLTDTANADMTLGDFLDQNHYSQRFIDGYILPMASAVWSTSLVEMRDFPAFTLLRFFDNHGFLGINTHYQWKYVVGGSSSYIPPLTAPYRRNIHLNAEILGVFRSQSGVRITFSKAAPFTCDEVVFACHGDQVLPMLADANNLEREIISAFKTSRNRTILHSDITVLPERESARASWNYHSGIKQSSHGGATMTYDMNRLQKLPSQETFCVTLNANGDIDREKILRDLEYHHPLFTRTSVKAQSRWHEISGKNHTHYCGAYWFNGFHEDGLNSAIRVANSFGIEW
jgi:predicted NAD/FAD-binding protein